MTDRCESLDAYVDDELDADERAAFELHLASCETCGAELPRLLALVAAFDGAAEASAQAARPRLTLVGERDADPELESRAAERSDKQRTTPARLTARRRAWIAATSAVALAAGVAVAVGVPGNDPPSAPLVASLADELGPTRPFDMRLSYPGTEAHRQVDVQRGAEAGSTSARRRQRELELERAGNWHGLAVLALLAGDRSNAAAAFDKAPSTPQISSDRAALELLDGSPAALERALEAADHALASAPGHAAARWNRALSLERLNLPLAAALDFDRVVALGEQGWAEEARDRAKVLRSQVAARRVHWKRVNDAGRALIKDGTPVPSELTDVTGHMTIRLYDAVRAAPSRAAVEALLPLAQTLDRAYHTDHMTAYVQRIAASDFRARKPLADAYRELVLGDMPKTAVDGFVKRLEQPGAEDIWLGAVLRTKRTASQLEAYRQRVTATRDPWLLAIAEQETARAELARGERAAGEARLRDAIVSARRARLAYRVTLLHNDLVGLYRRIQNLAQAHRDAQIVHRDATSQGEGVIEMNALTDLAAINQDRYANRLARAYLTEILERTNTGPEVGPRPQVDSINCTTRKYAHEALANVSMQLGEPERARAELSGAPACTGPTLLGTLVRADLYRLERRDDDLRIARDHLAALRADPSTAAPAQALLSYIEGTLLIDVDRSAGQRALRDAITRADHHTDEYNYSVKARAYSFSQLALDAGRASEFGRVVEILAETLEVGKPERCAVAIATQDERTVVAFVDARGATAGTYLVSASGTLDVAKLVPASAVERLRACERVVVLTRAPVLGAGRLLPPEIAWSYLLKGASSQAAATGRHLVIANPEAPADLRLPSLRPYPDTASADAVVLRGADATPTRVTQAMRDASVIEFHTHGFIGNDVSEASYLVLSPELDRQYAMTASDVARVKLEATPLVILGACHAATSSRSKEGGMGLAEAFLRSGARAVVASSDAVQDLGATEFFAGVRDRVLRGADPVVALRDERLHRLGKSHHDAWISGVVVFE
jgi:hypothetical protein